jgi:MFS family permease
MRTPSMGRLFFAFLTNYSSLTLILGLWGGPYLTHVYGFDLKGRGEILLIPAVTQILGAFLWGPADRLFGRFKVPALTGLGLSMTALLVLAVLGQPPLVVLLLVLAVLGFSSAMTPLLMAHGRALIDPHLLGRGMTLLNIGSIGGVFLSQTVSGVVIELFPSLNGAYPVDAYRAVFALQALFVLVSWVCYLGARDPLRDVPHAGTGLPKK